MTHEEPPEPPEAKNGFSETAVAATPCQCVTSATKSVNSLAGPSEIIVAGVEELGYGRLCGDTSKDEDRQEAEHGHIDADGEEDGLRVPPLDKEPRKCGVSSDNFWTRRCSGLFLNWVTYCAQK